MKIYPLSYSEEEASVIINMGLSKLQKTRKAPYTQILNGEAPPFYKDGGSVRYRWEDVMEYMDSRTLFGKPKKKDKKEEEPKEETVQPNRAINSPASPFINRLNY